MNILSILYKIKSLNELGLIKDETKNLNKKILKLSKQKNISYNLNGNKQKISKELLINELEQILQTKTIERTRYYLNRLIKSLEVQKEGKINDLNLNRWKEYNDILTDSLWLFDKRDTSGVHKADYWGNFIPQIPNQLLRRYTKRGEWVLDPFLGSGTTLIECKRLGRNGVGIELNKEVCKKAESTLHKENNPFKVTTKILTGNSARIDFKTELKNLKQKSFQFMIMHPPYWDIIKFSNQKDDLSNANSVSEFVNLFGKIAENMYPFLDKGRYCAVVIGDKYSTGEWIPLGFYVMQEMINRGFKLKSTIVKNFDQTTAKRNQKELWRYRALAGGFYIFKHEYIFLFKK
ncbi:MAG: DNA methyltransferase [Ignavibacteriaceae bacterium]|nr:DNA methyltransferase [Ignavibacteriaceae bacterium]MCW8817762.1 DNA methyltransferase [Ignavibacteriaceae bacterium]MCW8823755.1 DNA methyltransferase [Ignavibacteriaceae bacterium]MCW8995422.1 DNA methyltransferase [Psychromonas sp.]